jgi:hypothetical protein
VWCTYRVSGKGKTAVLLVAATVQRLHLSSAYELQLSPRKTTSCTTRCRTVIWCARSWGHRFCYKANRHARILPPELKSCPAELLPVACAAFATVVACSPSPRHPQNRQRAAHTSTNGLLNLQPVQLVSGTITPVGPFRGTNYSGLLSLLTPRS